ncbi:MAG: Uroporphyrinogen decarboxylase [Actinomycetota bacterium]
MILTKAHPLNSGLTSQSNLVKNLRSVRTNSLPIWFMRQAGRSLPEYRKLREGVAMLDSCLTPDLAVEITLQPVRRHGVDAAIFFSDIVIPLKLAGIEVDIVSGVGPVIAHPIRSHEAADALNLIAEESLEPIRLAVQKLIDELGSTPLIGFGGAPFTLASYLIEGGPSRDLPVSRAMMQNDPKLWNKILTWCADVTAQFITTQVSSGASALQVFDSWAGRLSPADYATFAAPHSQHLFEQLAQLVDSNGLPVPRIHFGVGTGSILKDMHAVGATAMGVDSETDLAWANQQFGGQVPLQGNISTDVLNRPWAEIAEHVKHVVESGKSAPGHVVNLGHGVPADTQPEILTRITEYVHQLTA